MLTKERNYDFRKRIAIVHEKNIRNFDLKAAEDEFEIKNGAKIVIPQNAGEVITIAVKDFQDYLYTSHKVSVSVCEGLENATKGDVIVATSEITGDNLGEYATYKGEITTVSDCVKIIGYDERGAMSGLYFAEDMMTFRRAPFLKKGEHPRKPMYSPQMVHSGYGLDKYPDDYLSAVSHQGRDAILIFVKGMDMTTVGYLDFNDLIYRAKKYGIDVYAYSYYESEKCYDDPDAEGYYENQYGILFKNCPDLKGVTLVGESIGFPSKDPHVVGSLPKHSFIDGIPTGTCSAGYYPCYDYPRWLNLLKKVITKYKPDADIVLWSYNWGFQPEEVRRKLIESLPDGITLQATFEMFHHYDLNGVVEECADYTLSFEGPSYYFKTEAQAAKDADVKLYSMTNTGGLSWDLGVIPYEPFPYQWMKRYKEMEKAHDNWGLQGLMESHHYGLYPSFISKLSKWIFSEPRVNPEEMLKVILKNEFGESNIEKVDKAMKLWSEGITHYVATDADQYGAMRVGPSYPLQIDTEIYLKSVPHAHFGSQICLPFYHNEAKSRLTYVSIRVPEEIASFKKMLALIDEGNEVLESIEVKNEKLERLINMGKFIACSIVTAINAKEMYRLTSKMRACENRDEMRDILDKIEALVKDEIKNAETAIPLVEVDSRLGWEPSMEYLTDKEHIEWKIKLERYVLDIEIPNLRKVTDIKVED